LDVCILHRQEMIMHIWSRWKFIRFTK
jgi:hypothetical protein